MQSPESDSFSTSVPTRFTPTHTPGKHPLSAVTSVGKLLGRGEHYQLVAADSARSLVNHSVLTAPTGATQI